MFPSPIGREGGRPYQGPYPVHPLAVQVNAIHSPIAQAVPRGSTVSDHSIASDQNLPSSFSNVRPTEIKEYPLFANLKPAELINKLNELANGSHLDELTVNALTPRLEKLACNAPNYFFDNTQNSVSPIEQALLTVGVFRQLAIKLVTLMSDKGLREAQYLLGMDHLRSVCRPKEALSYGPDISNAVELLQRAANQGHWRAKSYLALLHFADLCGPVHAKECIELTAEALTIRLHEIPEIHPDNDPLLITQATKSLYAQLTKTSEHPFGDALRYQQSTYMLTLSTLTKKKNGQQASSSCSIYHENQLFKEIAENLLLPCESESQTFLPSSSPMNGSQIYSLCSSSSASVTMSSALSLQESSFNRSPRSPSSLACRQPTRRALSIAEKLCRLMNQTSRNWNEISQLILKDDIYWVRNHSGQTILHLFCIDMPDKLPSECLKNIHNWIERYPQSLQDKDREGDTPLTYLEVIHKNKKNPMVDKFLDELELRGYNETSQIKANIRKTKHKR